MPDFKSSNSFEIFASSIKRRARYLLEAETKEFLETVLATAGPRIRTLQRGSIYWRAQDGYELGHYPPPNEDLPQLVPRPVERLIPKPDTLIDGRINPKGIPSCLYLSNDRDTAMSETRPAVGDYVSVAQFELLKDLRIVDCSVEQGDDYIFHFQELAPAERVKAVWTAIDQAFSEPVNRNDASLEYVPTQAIAECFRTNAFDGLLYQSRLGRGLNVALFDIGSARLLSRSLHRAKRVCYQFEEICNS